MADPTTPLEYALAYARHGWHVFPVWGTTEDGSCTCGFATCTHSPKAPHGMLGASGGFQHATADAQKIEAYWREGPEAGIGLALTEASGLLAIDLDTYKDPEARDWLVDQLGGEMEARRHFRGPVQLTARGGIHMVYRRPNVDGATIRLRRDLPAGVEWKGNGYIVVEPTVFRFGEDGEGGGAYRWAQRPPWKTRALDVETISPQLFHLLFDTEDQLGDSIPGESMPILEVLNKVDDTLTFAMAPEEAHRRYGSRHDALVKLAVYARRQGHSQSLAGALYEYRDKLQPLDDREIPDKELDSIVRSVSTYPVSEDAIRERVRWALKGDLPERARRHLEAFLTGEILEDEPTEAPDEAEEDDDLEHLDAEERSVIELNKRYSFVVYGGQAFVAELDYRNPEMGYREIRILQVGAFKLQHDNKTINVGSAKKPKYIGVGSHWLKHPMRRTAPNGLVFAPEEEIEGTENLWQGWGVKEREGDWGKLRSLLYYLCNEDEVIFKKILQWCAFGVQNPGDIATLVPVFVGPQGIGKSMFWNAWRSLFGAHGKLITSNSLVGGRFNSYVADACAVIFSEVTWGGDVVAAGGLKNLATETYITLERKGKDAIPLRNRSKIVILSNETFSAPVEATNRRFLVVETAPEMKQTPEFYAACAAQASSPEALGAMLYDLRRMDISDFDPYEMVHTEGEHNQMLRGFKPLELWWVECLESGYLPNSHVDEQSFSSANEDRMLWAGSPVRRDAVLNSFLFFCKQRGLKTHEAGTQSQIAKAVKRFSPGLKIKTQYQTRRATDRARHIYFDSLSAHREAWKRFTDRDDWGWDDED